MEVTWCLSFRNVSLVSQFNILQQHDTSNDFLKQLSADSINRSKFILSEQLLFFHQGHSVRKVRLLLGTINSPIILATDLTEFIIPAHSQQLLFSALMIAWNRIPVLQCGAFASGANEFTVINAFTTNNSGMHDWSPLLGACPLQVTFNWISK